MHWPAQEHQTAWKTTDDNWNGGSLILSQHLTNSSFELKHKVCIPTTSGSNLWTWWHINRTSTSMKKCRPKCTCTERLCVSGLEGRSRVWAEHVWGVKCLSAVQRECYLICMTHGHYSCRDQLKDIGNKHIWLKVIFSAIRHFRISSPDVTECHIMNVVWDKRATEQKSEHYMRAKLSLKPCH